MKKQILGVFLMLAMFIIGFVAVTYQTSPPEKEVVLQKQTGNAAGKSLSPLVVECPEVTATPAKFNPSAESIREFQNTYGVQPGPADSVKVRIRKRFKSDLNVKAQENRRENLTTANPDILHSSVPRFIPRE